MKERSFPELSFPELSKVINEDGTTVAHLMVLFGEWMTDDPEYLLLAYYKGWTVAHAQALNGWITNDFGILALSDDNNG